LILTPGIYSLDEPIRVLCPDTVVLGLGFPTLVPRQGKASMEIANAPGVKLSGVIFDVGPINSRVLLQVGLLPNFPILRHAGSDPNNPTLIQDVFFRIGVQFHDLVTVSLGGVGTIEHVINDTGGTANTSNQVIDLLSYP
jgi:hypothetical protein